MLNLDFEAQGRGSTFTLCHDHLKKAISLGKLQKVQDFCTGLYVAEIGLMKFIHIDHCFIQQYACT